MAGIGQSAQIRKHLTSSGVGVASSALGTIVVFLIVARMAGPSLFGQFGQAYATCAFLGILVDWGYPQRMLRDLPRYEREVGGIPLRTLYLKGLIAVTMTAAGLAVFWLTQMNMALFAVIWSGILLISFGNFFGAVNRGFERHGTDSRNLFAANLSGTGLAMILASAAVRDPLFYALAFPVNGLIYLSLAWRLTAQLTELKREPLQWASLIIEIKEGWSYCTDVFTARSYGTFDVMILAALTPPISVGYYQAGQKLAQGAALMVQPIQNVIIPRLSRLPIASHAWSILSFRTIFGLLAMGGIVALAFATLGPSAVQISYGNLYQSLHSNIFIFGLVVLARFASASLGILLVSMGLQRVRMRINLVNMIGYVAVGFLLTSAWDYEGMAWAGVISGVTGFGAFAFCIRRHLAKLRQGSRLRVSSSASRLDGPSDEA